MVSQKDTKPVLRPWPYPSSSSLLLVFLTTVVVVTGASTGVADVAEKFDSFLEKKRGEGYVQQDLLVVTA